MNTDADRSYKTAQVSTFFGKTLPYRESIVTIFLTSKVSFTDQKLGYRVTVITVICPPHRYMEVTYKPDF